MVNMYQIWDKKLDVSTGNNCDWLKRSEIVTFLSESSNE